MGDMERITLLLEKQEKKKFRIRTIETNTDMSNLLEKFVIEFNKNPQKMIKALGGIE
ncbi:MAG: hypothetical protein ACI37T_09535 [Candidatus Gastranaerophilaceae bacterium]